MKKETMIDLGKSLLTIVGITLFFVAFLALTIKYPGVLFAIIFVGSWVAFYDLYKKKREIDSKR